MHDIPKKLADLFVGDYHGLGQATNQATIIAPGAIVLEACSFKEAFFAAFGPARAASVEQHEPVLVIAAVGAGGVRVISIPADPSRAVTAIVGRHAQCDLQLEGDVTVSLRQLAVIVSPAADNSALLFRVVDLRTTIGFETKQGERLEAVEASGPLLIGCGIHRLLFFPRANDSALPNDPEQVWQTVNSGVIARSRRPSAAHAEISFDEEAPTDSSDASSFPVPGARSAPAPHHSVAGPLLAWPRPALEMEGSLGVLHLSSKRGQAVVPIGSAEASRGILLGRYPRSDGPAHLVLADQELSRLHLLVIQIEDILYAIDLASTNGTWTAGGKLCRSEPLSPGSHIILGKCSAFVEWKLPGSLYLSDHRAEA